MASKKVGPPVPPRPAATNVVQAVTRAQSSSPSTPNKFMNGRTIVYKSSVGSDLKEATAVSDDKKKTVTLISNEDKLTPKRRPIPPVPRPRLKSPIRIASPMSIAKENRLQGESVQTSREDKISIVSTSLEVENNQKSLEITEPIDGRTFFTSKSFKNRPELLHPNEQVNHKPTPKDLTKDDRQNLKTQIVIDSSVSQTVDFTNKILCEMETIIKNSKSHQQRLPSRPEPEGKEGHQVSQKSVEERISESKTAFSKKLLSELTAIRKNDSSKVLVKDERTFSKEEEEQIVILKRRPKDNVTNSVSPVEVSPNFMKSRIRTSDWIEVEDNGKAILMTSCHISLEDSGMEDEEKPDDASSGVGDSWDSVKDTEER